MTGWDLPSLSQIDINSLESAGAYLMSPALRPDGNGMVSRWLELRTGTVTEVVMPEDWRPSRLVFNQDDLVSWQGGDRALVAGGRDDRRQVLVDLTAGTAERSPSTRQLAPDAVTVNLLGYRVEFEPDPRGVLSHTGSLVRILDRQTVEQREVAVRVDRSNLYDLTVAAGRMVVVDDDDRFHVLDADP